MANRFRNRDIHVMLTDEEYDLFQHKFKQSKSKTMSHFIRKCVLEKEIYVVDMSVFYRLQHLLAKNSNNLNQIAKQINTTAVVYKKDIEFLKNMNLDFSKRLYNIQKVLSENLANRTA